MAPKHTASKHRAPKPKAPEGYIRFGKHYVSLLLLLAVFFGLLVLLVLYPTVIHGAVMQRWYSMQELPEFQIDSPYLAGYSGKARLVLPDGTLLYEGGVEAAAAQGEGTLYERDALVYEGEFSENMYHGKGTLYYPSGGIMYKGGFKGNVYMGEGTLYDEVGNLLYEGPFSVGAYVGLGTLHILRGGIHYTYIGNFDVGAQNGEGKLYAGAKLVYEGGFVNGLYNGEGIEYVNGSIAYSGGFVNGSREGEGVLYQGKRLLYKGSFTDGRYEGGGMLYDEDGLLFYEGSFSAGKYEGEGRLYDNGVLLYTGGFAAGLFNGEGVLYGGGAPVYEGGFANGKYEGAGKSYENGALRYDGEFTKGVYSGEGKLYDNNGRLMYNGGFLMGLYDGPGKLYQNGALLYEGEFASGKYNGEGTEYDITTGFAVFAGRYLENERMEAGVAFGDDGEESAVPAFSQIIDPISLIGWRYDDVAATLANFEITLKEQLIDDLQLAADEAAEAVYCFLAPDGETPGALIYIYLYGATAVEGIAVGADISGVETPFVGNEDIQTHDVVVLGYYNAASGQSLSTLNMQCAVFTGERYTVAAYYLPQEGEILFIKVELTNVG